MKKSRYGLLAGSELLPSSAALDLEPSPLKVSQRSVSHAYILDAIKC